MNRSLSFALSTALIASFTSCGGGGGSDGGGGSGTSRDLVLAVVDEGGFVTDLEAGIELVEGGVSRRIAVLEVEGTSIADRTNDALVALGGGSVAVLAGEWLEPGMAGTTTLSASLDGLDAEVAVHTFPIASAPVRELEIEPLASLVLVDATPTPAVATLVLASGDVVPAAARVDWRSLDESVVTVDANGLCTPVVDGATYIEASLDGGAIVERLEVVVALPRASGSVLDDTGGTIAAGPAAAWFPPLALGAPTNVEVSTVDEAELPAMLPPGATFGGAVEVTSPSVASYEVPATVTFDPGEGAQVGELAQILFYSVINESYMHYAWVGVGPLGRYEWVTDIPSLFVVVPAPGAAQEFALQHAPNLIIGENDIAPLRLEDILAHCDLYVNDGVFSDTRITATPTPADLLANNTARHYLRLDVGAASDFDVTASWGMARLGGMMRTNGPRPAVYWSVRPVVISRGRAGGSRSVLAVQYWLLSAASGKPQGLSFAFGDYDLQHEGDLEFVQVLLDGNREIPEPIAATASQHYYGEGRAYRDVVTSQGRLDAFVSQAGHATYFERGFGGTGLTHGTARGNEGFIGKAFLAVFETTDVCPAAADEVRLSPQSDYDLVALDGADPGSMALKRWRGLFHTVEFVPRRSPQAPALGMDRFPMRFHFAYDYSTDTSIRAYDEASPANVAARVRMGRRMFDVQEHVRAENATGGVQSRIDSACPPQPQHLVDYLEAGEHYSAPKYFACDEWHVTRVTPPAPRMGTVGTSFPLTVDWSSVSQGALDAIAQPLRIIVLASGDGGHQVQQTGSYEGSAGTVNFRVVPELVISDADIGATSHTVNLEWTYEEGGVAMSPPQAACDAVTEDMDWRFHLFVRDAAGITLYHTNSLTVGPFEFERDGPPIDVRTTLCD